MPRDEDSRRALIYKRCDSDLSFSDLQLYQVDNRHRSSARFSCERSTTSHHTPARFEAAGSALAGQTAAAYGAGPSEDHVPASRRDRAFLQNTRGASRKINQVLSLQNQDGTRNWLCDSIATLQEHCMARIA